MDSHKLNQITYSPSFRNFLMLPVALVFSLALFRLLSDLTSKEGLNLDRKPVTPELEFLLVRQESDLEIRSRRRPLPPEEITEPEIFTRKTFSKLEPISVDITQINFDMPRIDVGLAIDMSSALTNLSTVNVSRQMFAVDIPFQDQLKVTKNVVPHYPSRAQRKRIEGRLVAEFLVDAEGKVKEESIKFVEANPKDMFEKEVIRSLKRSRFEPMIEQGKGLIYRARKTYRFKMPK